MSLKKLVFLVVLFLLIWGSLSFGGEQKTHIGILYFVPKGEDIPWIRKGITILLIDRFTQFDTFDILTRDRLNKVDYNLFTAKNVKNIADKFSLDYVVGGTYLLSKDGILTVNAWVWGRKGDKFLVSFTAKGDFLSVVKKVAISAYDVIAGTTTDKASKLLGALPTKNLDACKYLFTAVDYMDQAISTYSGADFPSKPLWKKAIDMGEKAVEIDPKFSLAYYYLGLIYSKTKWVKREAEAWENYLKYTTQREVPGEIGALAYYRLGYSFYEKKVYDLAEKYLRKAIEIDQSLVKPYIYLGNIYYEKDELDRAISYYQKAYEINPTDKDVEWLLKRAERVKEVGKEAYEYFEKGRAAFLQKNYIEATYYLEHAIGINPSYLEAFVLLGKSYMELNNLDRAYEMLKQAEELDPTNYEIKLLIDRVKNEIKYGKEAYEAFDKGYDLYTKGDLQGALSYFKEAIDKNPKYDIAHDYLARIYYRMGRLDEYRREREEVATLTKNPKEKADIYYLTGYEFFSLKRYQIAKEEFEKALKFFPGHVKTLFFMGEVFYNLKEYKNAIYYYTKVINSAKGEDFYDKALYGRAWSYFYLKEYKEEIEDFLRIVNEFKDSPFRIVSQYKLGEAYYIVGDYIDAIKWLKDFIKIENSPYRKDALYIVIASYIKTKGLKDAKQYLDMALTLYPDSKDFYELRDLLRDYAFNSKEYKILLETLKGKKDEVSSYEKIVALWNLGREDEAEFQFSIFRQKYPESKYLKDICTLFLSKYINSDKKKAIDILTYAIDKKIPIFPSVYKSYFIRGKLYYNLKDYSNAIGDFEKAIEGEFEGVSEAYYLLGLSYDKMGRRDKALTILERVGEKFKDTYSCLGNYYVGSFYYEKKEWDLALKYYKKITLTCKSVDYLDKVHFYLGMIHYNKGNFGSAIWNFKRSISLLKHKDLKIADYYFIGKSYIKWGKIEDGKKWLKKVIDGGEGSKYYLLAKEELKRTSQIPYKEASNLIAKGDYKEAISILSKIGDKDDRKIYLLAKAYIGLKNWGRAEELFLKLLDKKTTMYEDVVYGLSYVYFKEKKYFLLTGLSEDYLKKGIYGNLGDDILYLSALAYEMLGKEEDAKNVYKEILKLFPDTPLKDKIEKRLEVIK